MDTLQRESSLNKKGFMREYSKFLRKHHPEIKFKELSVVSQLCVEFNLSVLAILRMHTMKFNILADNPSLKTIDSLFEDMDPERAANQILDTYKDVQEVKNRHVCKSSKRLKVALIDSGLNRYQFDTAVFDESSIPEYMTKIDGFRVGDVTCHDPTGHGTKVAYIFFKTCCTCVDATIYQHLPDNTVSDFLNCFQDASSNEVVFLVICKNCKTPDQ
jgi:hypothetical protein